MTGTVKNIPAGTRRSLLREQEEKDLGERDGVAPGSAGDSSFDPEAPDEQSRLEQQAQARKEEFALRSANPTGQPVTREKLLMQMNREGSGLGPQEHAGLAIDGDKSEGMLTAAGEGALVSPEGTVVSKEGTVVEPGTEDTDTGSNETPAEVTRESLNALSTTKLRAMASDRQIEGRSTLSRIQLVNAIVKDEAAKAEKPATSGSGGAPTP